MKIYLVIEVEPYMEYEGAVKAYKSEEDAKKFIEYRDKMTGCLYRIEEIELE